MFYMPVSMLEFVSVSETVFYVSAISAASIDGLLANCLGFGVKGQVHSMTKYCQRL